MTARRWADCIRKVFPPTQCDQAAWYGPYAKDWAPHGTYAGLYGRTISFFLQLHDVTGETEYLDFARQVARESLSKLYYRGLIRGHACKPYYEAIDGVGYLLVALLELDAAVGKTTNTVGKDIRTESPGAPSSLGELVCSDRLHAVWPAQENHIMHPRTVANILLVLLMMETSIVRTVMADEQDVEFLLDGVQEIAAPGVPGPLSVFGEKAFAVVAAGPDTARQPVVAAGRMGAGRVVAFGHTGYLGNHKLYETGQTGCLMVNAVRWAAGQKSHSAGSPKVGVFHQPGTLKYLKTQNLNAVAPGRPPMARQDRVL